MYIHTYTHTFIHTFMQSNEGTEFGKDVVRIVGTKSGKAAVTIFKGDNHWVDDWYVNTCMHTYM
jgi:hypothetical protein